MRTLGKLMHHLQLVSRMAKATQTDLVDAVSAGDINQNDWAEMVQTCRRCEWAGQCQSWLDHNAGSAEPPQSCLNRDQFRSLKAKARRRNSERV